MADKLTDKEISRRTFNKIIIGAGLGLLPFIHASNENLHKSESSELQELNIQETFFNNIKNIAAAVEKSSDFQLIHIFTKNTQDKSGEEVEADLNIKKGESGEVQESLVLTDAYGDRLPDSATMGVDGLDAIRVSEGSVIGYEVIYPYKNLNNRHILVKRDSSIVFPAGFDEITIQTTSSYDEWKDILKNDKPITVERTVKVTMNTKTGKEKTNTEYTKLISGSKVDAGTVASEFFDLDSTYQGQNVV